VSLPTLTVVELRPEIEGFPGVFHNRALRRPQER
jgi:hypothetical protein